MRVLVVGGFGYLGSIITDLLTVGGKYEVDVEDICLWNNNLTDQISFNQNKLIRRSSEYDCVVWCASIDSLEFYSWDYSKIFLKNQLERFKDIVKHTNKFINCSDYNSYLTQNLMTDYFVELENIVNHKNGAISVKIPTLHGPSPRMRWDTIPNQIIFDCICNNNKIFVGEDCLTSLPLAGVLDAAKHIVELIKGKEEFKEHVFLTESYSLLEMANIIALCMNGKVEIVAKKLRKLQLSWDCLYGTASLYKQTLAKSCEDITKNLEQNNLPNFMSDKYHNSTMINNAINSAEFLECIQSRL